MRELIQHAAPAGSDTLAVDVGCGTGGNIAALADCYRCVGIDESEQAIVHARSHHPAVEFVRSVDPAVIARYLQRANLVTCMDVIEHVERDAALVEQIVRSTRPGTLLLLTVPRSEERRVGKECRVRGWPDQEETK